MIPRTVGKAVQALALAERAPVLPVAAGEMRLRFVRGRDSASGMAYDRVHVLLDSPGPPPEWGGPQDAPIRVLVVPLGIAGRGQDGATWESYAAHEILRLMELNRATARSEKKARYAVMDGSCHRHAYDAEWPGCEEVLVQHANEEVLAPDGKPAGWCWFCWHTRKIKEMQACIDRLTDETAQARP